MTRAAWPMRALAGAGVALGVALSLSSTPGEAHKAVTSKYHFNEELFPLFRDHCGRCHVDGGVAPMSLLTYDDAAPWGESLRLELLSEEAKPWHDWRRLTPRELDMILVWATGGSPRGDAAKTPPPVALVNEWGSGEPDIALTMPTPFTLDASRNEATAEVTFLDGARGRTIGAVDLKPGTPSIVRTATIALKTADGRTTPLASWVAGAAQAIELKSPVVVPKGAAIVATIEYRRTWKYEGQALTDRSTIGLYEPKASTATPRRSPGR